MFARNESSPTLFVALAWIFYTVSAICESNSHNFPIRPTPMTRQSLGTLTHPINHRLTNPDNHPEKTTPAITINRFRDTGNTSSTNLGRPISPLLPRDATRACAPRGPRNKWGAAAGGPRLTWYNADRKRPLVTADGTVLTFWRSIYARVGAFCVFIWCGLCLRVGFDWPFFAWGVFMVAIFFFVNNVLGIDFCFLIVVDVCIFGVLNVFVMD